MSDSAEQRTINYAEQVLRVHDVYFDASAALDDLKTAQAAVIEWADQRRRINERVSDREMYLASVSRAGWTDSQAAFDRYLKEVLHTDADLKQLRSDALDAHAAHEQAEAMVRQTEFRLKVATARMEQLGGLLSFYGATKVAKATLATTPTPA